MSRVFYAIAMAIAFSRSPSPDRRPHPPHPTDSKTFKKPRRPFEKERLDNEMKLIGEFGLKNKREVWRVGLAMARIRKAARILLTLDEKDPKRPARWYLVIIRASAPT